MGTETHAYTPMLRGRSGTQELFFTHHVVDRVLPKEPRTKPIEP
jgi:hypothetical protein